MRILFPSKSSSVEAISSASASLLCQTNDQLRGYKGAEAGSVAMLASRLQKVGGLSTVHAQHSLLCTYLGRGILASEGL